MSLDPLSPAFAIAAAGALVAGVVRGFSGFGGAMILVPILAVAYAPAVAVPVLYILDLVLTLPLAWRARRRCAWREVLPLVLGHTVALPVGLALLLIADPIALTRVMGVVVLTVALLMALGLRRRATPGPPGTLLVGGVAGVLAGSTGIGGPPVILFWLSGQDTAPTMRANIIVYFSLAAALTLAGLVAAGLVTAFVLGLTLALAPAYAVGLFLGARAFGASDDRLYRWLALGIIGVAGAVALL